jgi:hypothetical protein
MKKSIKRSVNERELEFVVSEPQKKIKIEIIDLI